MLYYLMREKGFSSSFIEWIEPHPDGGNTLTATNVLETSPVYRQDHARDSTFGWKRVKTRGMHDAEVSSNYHATSRVTSVRCHNVRIQYFGG